MPMTDTSVLNSKSPCPKSTRRKLVLEVSKSKDAELSGSAPELATQTEDVVPPGNVVQPTSMPNVHAYV